MHTILFSYQCKPLVFQVAAGLEFSLTPCGLSQLSEKKRLSGLTLTLYGTSLHLDLQQYFVYFLCIDYVLMQNDPDTFLKENQQVSEPAREFPLRSGNCSSDSNHDIKLPQIFSSVLYCKSPGIYIMVGLHCYPFLYIISLHFLLSRLLRLVRMLSGWITGWLWQGFYLFTYLHGLLHLWIL